VFEPGGASPVYSPYTLNVPLNLEQYQMKSTAAGLPRAFSFIPFLVLSLSVQFGLGCADPKQTEGVPGVGQVGETCAPNGAFVCEGTDTNGPRELVCTDGTLVAYADCAGGCWIEVDRMGERYVACIQPTLVPPVSSEDAGTSQDSGSNRILPPDVLQD
jgi:hypothetical protein